MFIGIFEDELTKHGITWCRGCASFQSHKRGFAVIKSRTIHYDSQIATRATLWDGLHEIGHILTDSPKMKRWEKERAANLWATRRMREMKIAIPRRVSIKSAKYVRRMKRWGQNISNGLNLKPSQRRKGMKIEVIAKDKAVAEGVAEKLEKLIDNKHGGTRKGAGRKPELVNARRITVVIDAETEQKLKELGDGNVSKGVRRAVQ